MFTIGVEEEFHVVDPATRASVPGAGAVMAQIDEAHRDRVDRELQAGVIETCSTVCATLAELRQDLAAQRRAVAQAAQRAGLQVAAAGTLPLLDGDSQRVSPGRRYQQMLDDYQQLVREQFICGTQTHVGVDRREEALEVANRIRVWLPALLALSASSPYWAGRDTGFASYRSQMWSRWPTAGIPPAFSSLEEYDGLVKTLVTTGTISDEGMIYWDARPSARYQTVEVRVADSCPSLDDVVLQAGLTRALVMTAHAQLQRGEPGPEIPRELLIAAKWHGARFGLEGELVDAVERASVPAPVAVQRLLHAVRPALEEQGDWDEVCALAGQALGRGMAAYRQRRAFQGEGRLTDVVDLMVAETAAV